MGWAPGAWAPDAWAGTAWATQSSPVEVPDVVGEPQASATAALQGAGFVVSVQTAYSSTVPAGDVISQSPQAGSMLAPGATVTITVSLGEAPPAAQAATGGWWTFDPYRYRRRRKTEPTNKEIKAAEQAEQIVERVAEKVTDAIPFPTEEQRREWLREELHRVGVLFDAYAQARLREAIERKRQEEEDDEAALLAILAALD